MSNLPRLIIGTAGHVDHGKTELIRALTGINADRWREEQERGMTIDLGFAYLDLPGGGRAAIVDVPGHERFIHNMLAGATGIDLVLLVVAADEGVMPQTREHVAILDLLGVSEGIVVLTKADRADADMIEIVREDVRDLLATTGLADAPQVVTSARTGEGMDDLVRAVDEAAGRVRAHDVDGPARMPIDRSFTIGGHGTVVTGSLLRGRLRVGQQVAIIPAGLETRVRRLEVHGDFVDEIAAPARVGANLADVPRDSIHRGDQLVEPASMPASWLLDVELRLLPTAKRPLRQRAPIFVHMLTAEASGRAALLDGRDALAPGETAVAQVRLDRRVACAAGDRFVVRAYSPPTTIGGGVVLDPAPRRHRTGRVEIVEAVEAMRSGSPLRMVEEMVRQRGRAGATTDEVRLHLQLTAEQVDEVIRQAAEAGAIAWIGDRWVAGEEHGRLTGLIADALADYHRRQPLRLVMPMRDLQAATNAPLAALQAIVRAMAEAGRVVADKGGARLADHAPSLCGEIGKLAEKAMATIRAAGMDAPDRAAALQALGGDEGAPGLLDYLLAQGDLVAVGDHIYAAEALAEAQDILRRHFTGRAFTVAVARDALASTRKYIVPLLEHFDRTGFTTRRGDERRLRE
jgi:selenocysteine-specific elongation factor